MEHLLNGTRAGSENPLVGVGAVVTATGGQQRKGSWGGNAQKEGVRGAPTREGARQREGKVCKGLGGGGFQTYRKVEKITYPALHSRLTLAGSLITVNEPISDTWLLTKALG